MKETVLHVHDDERRLIEPGPGISDAAEPSVRVVLVVVAHDRHLLHEIQPTIALAIDRNRGPRSSRRAQRGGLVPSRARSRYYRRAP